MENYEQRVLNKLDAIDGHINKLHTRVEVGFAELPHKYIPRGEFDAVKKEQKVQRRWLITTIVAAALGIAANWPF